MSRSVAFGSQPAPGEVPARGVVTFAKPGRMRWSYEEPAPSLMVSDGESLWIHDPVAGEASRTSVEQGAGSGAALQFLMGEGSLLDEFRVTSAACSLEAERVELDLVPLRPATYERMGLVADPRKGEILATHVVDLFGNLTRLSFSDVKYDVSPSADLFEFVPPEGTEVVDLLAPP